MWSSVSMRTVLISNVSILLTVESCSEIKTTSLNLCKASFTSICCCVLLYNLTNQNDIFNEICSLFYFLVWNIAFFRTAFQTTGLLCVLYNLINVNEFYWKKLKAIKVRNQNLLKRRIGIYSYIRIDFLMKRKIKCLFYIITVYDRKIWNYLRSPLKSHQRLC